jgi:LacI family transcriptional regulator
VARAVTLSDVAAHAKVDLSTASRVLRGGGRVSDATRQRILDAAAELDFLPNAQAQFLATGRSNTVGIVTVNAPGVFALPVLAGASTALGRREIATLLYDARFDPEEFRESARRLRARQIDGVMVIGNGLLDPIRSVSDGFDVPVVYAFGISDDPRDAWFMPDGVMAGRLAGQHLVDLGRRRIAHVTARLDVGAHDRAEGLRQVLDEAGLSLALGHPLEGDWQRVWGAEAARRILDEKADIDAVFCGNDQIALGMYGVFRAAGVRIPDDIALVGVDDWEAMVGDGPHLLTTIDPDLLGLGFAAAEYLTTLDTEGFVPGPHYHPGALVLGETTMGAGPRTAGDTEGHV